MLFFIILSVVTLIIVWLQLLIWRKTKNFLLILPTIFIYYWSIAGAWFIVFDLLNNNRLAEIGLHYYDYFNKLFSIELNKDYHASIIYLSLFIISNQLAVLFFVKNKTVAFSTPAKLILRHETLIFISLSSLVLSMYFIHQQMQEAMEHHESFYIFISHSPTKYYPLYQIFKSCSLLSAYFGLVIYLNRENSKYFIGNKFRFGIVIYFFLMLVVMFYSLLLGSRHDLVFSALFGFLIFFINSERIKYVHLFILVSSLLLGVFMIELTRGIPLLDYLGLNMGSEPTGKTEIQFSGNQTFISLLFSNELFTGHMSMYGAIHSKLPLTHGTSFTSLFSSLLPRFFVPERPPDIYQYYISIAQNPGLQGFTINHATGWYLNFGVPGVIAGGILLGLLIAICRNIFHIQSKPANSFYMCIRISSLSGIVSFIPMLIRAGPEAYKSLIFEGVIIPVSIIWISQFSLISILTFGLKKE